MNILGVDYGKKRIGLAWCDTAVGVVLPFGVVETSDFGLQTSALVALIQKERIEKVVVGLPLGLDGKENENTKTVQTFVDMLKSEVRVPIAMVDERFTSAQADRMTGGDASRDEKAAMVIVQTYIESRK